MPRFIVLFIGFLMLTMGLVVLMHPQIMNRYGLVVNSVHSEVTVRALIGGAEIGLGLIMVFGGKLGVSTLSRLWFALVLFGGVVFTRMFSTILVDEAIPHMVYRELIVEVFVCSILIFGIVKSKSYEVL